MDWRISKHKVSFVISAVLVFMLLDDLLQVILIPVLPMYYSKYHLNALHVGLILSMSPIFIVISSPIMGALIKKKDQIIRWACVCGVLIEAVVAILYGFAPKWWVLLFAASFEGLATAVVIPALSAGLAKQVPAEKRATYLVRVNVFASIGTLITPLLSAVLFAVWDIHTTFLILSVCLILLSPMLKVIMPNKTYTQEEYASHQLSAPKWIIIIVASISTFAAGLFELIAPVELAGKLHFSPTDMGIYLFVLGIGFAIPQLGVQLWIRKYGIRSLLLFGTIMMTIGFLTLSMLNPGWNLAIGGLLISPFPGLLLAASTYLAGDSDDIAESFGWVEAANSLGYLFGSLIGGFILNTFSLKITLLFGCIVPLISVFIWSSKKTKVVLMKDGPKGEMAMRRKSLLIQDTNSVVVHVINCLDNLNEETSEMWDLLCQAEHYFQFEYLKAVAKSNIDISFRYFLAELEGKLVGISFGYIMRFPIIGPIKIPTFISGTPVDLGFPFAISETVDQAVIFKALIKSMLDEARKSGTKFIAIRDVWDIKEIKCFESIFMDLGLQKVPLFNSAILDIKWNNFDEYLQALSHRYRGQVKYDLRKVYRSGYELKILHGNEAIPYCADFHRLWVNVFKSHPGDRDQVYLPVEYFKEMVSLPETVSLLMLRNAKLVGFDLLEKRGGLLDSTFCGQDYLLSGNDPVDRALTHEIVRYAIENGFGLLDFGVSNEAVKARIGCTFRELFGYVRPTGMNFLKISWVRGFLLRGYNLNMDTTYFPKQNVFQTET